ncbi:MAG: homoserine O-acetyltransferase [Alicyclobacillus sp.]|nr:homoserine O-acetyltransferase [Alicyclobacillus sp.]
MRVAVRAEDRSVQTARVWRRPGFALECGARLDVEVAYETWGELNTARDNAVVVCHALTGDARAGDTADGPGWWSAMVGPGKPIDTERYFVVCSNVLGGCAGTTGPSSIAPDGRPYALRFPEVSIRDMVRLQMELLDALHVAGIRAVVGGSLGGMQAWEWALLDPARVQHVMVIAAHAVFPPLAIGYNAAMRQAITADPMWCNGDYYAAGTIPEQGLALARTIGLLTYRAGDLYQQRFARRTCSEPRQGAPVERVEAGRAHAVAERRWRSPDGNGQAAAFTAPLFEVESYLAYNSRKFVRRFDANSYLYLTKAMDGHDIGRNRGGLAGALRQMRARLTLIGISSDYLYGARDLAKTAALAAAAGVRGTYLELDSQFGHDAFLREDPRLQAMVRDQLERV